MHGKSTFKKSLQRAQRAEVKGSYNSKQYMEIGSWRFEETSDGDLVIINIETKKTVILVNR